MCSLMKMEFGKLVRQKSFWISLIVFILFMLECYFGWVSPLGDDFYILAEDGTLLNGSEAVSQDRQDSERYRGVLSDEWVAQIVQNERDNEAQIEGMIQNAETSSPISISAPSAKRLVYYYFVNTDKLSGGKLDTLVYHYGEEELRPVKDVFPESAQPLYYEYSVQWGGTLEAVVTGIFLLNIFVFFGISPVFSEERAKKMNALLFTSRFGRRKCFWAKTLTVYAIGTVLAAGTVLLLTAITRLLFGTEGLQCSIQLVEPFLYQDCPSAKTLGTVIVDAVLLSTAGLFFTISLTILASVLARNSLDAFILSMVLSVSPLILRIFRIPDEIKLIAPVNRMFDFSGVMSVPDVSFRSMRAAYSHAAAGILLCASAVIILCAGTVYNRRAAD